MFCLGTRLHAFWLVTLVAFHVGQATQGRQPNIVFVLADDYGFHDVGYHGSEIRTPNLDELSANGVRLENYYVQPICTPTRSQLMSGRYQIRTGLQHGVIRPEFPNALPLDSPTIADKLREAGYSTHMVGKWHLGFYKRQYLPNHRGFDSFYGFYVGSQNHYTHERSSKLFHGQSFLDLHDNEEPVFTENGHYSTHLFTSKAIEKIRNHNASNPMFLYLAYFAVHSPLQVPERYTKPYGHIGNWKRRTYAGMVAAMDEGIGNLTQALKETGKWNNTIFIFSTDNGGQIRNGGNNYPLRGNKNSLWEGAIRGVAFVHAPNMSTAHTVSRELIHVSDWFPTLVGVAGGSLAGTKPLDGYDQWKTISEGTPGPRQHLLHTLNPRWRHVGARMFPNDTFDHRIHAAIRDGHWKLITGTPGDGSWNPHPQRPASTARNNPVDPPLKNLWLFNITADPTERNDLSAQNPRVVRRLLDLLQTYHRTAVPVRSPKPDPKSNPALRDNVWGPWM